MYSRLTFLQNYWKLKEKYFERFEDNNGVTINELSLVSISDKHATNARYAKPVQLKYTNRCITA